MANVTAIIFDLDGVLVNTIDLHEQAWHEVARAGGRNLNQRDLQALRGRRRNECLDLLFPKQELSTTVIDHYLTIKNNTYIEALLSQHPHDILARGATELIETAHESGLLLGVASSSINAKQVLAHVGLQDMFAVVADGATVARSKPAPDIFVWVAGALGIYPQTAVVFEDSLAGIQGASQAGMTVVGISNPETRLVANHYFGDLTEIDLHTLLHELDLTIAPPFQRSLIGDSDARN